MFSQGLNEKGRHRQINEWIQKLKGMDFLTNDVFSKITSEFNDSYSRRKDERDVKTLLFLWKQAVLSAHKDPRKDKILNCIAYACKCDIKDYDYYIWNIFVKDIQTWEHTDG